MTDTPAPGRGSWSTVGMPDGHSCYYDYAPGKPLVGAYAATHPDVDPNAFNLRAVTYGVKAYQALLNVQGFAVPALTVDGEFGRHTHAAVVNAQAKLGLDGAQFTAGRIGHDLSVALIRPLVKTAAGAKHVPYRDCLGIMQVESGFDLGAVGLYTPFDKSLIQANTAPNSHTGYTIAEAFNPAWAIEEVVDRQVTARARYAAKGTTLQRECALASHNSPEWADEWAATGEPPNKHIAQYVQSVMAAAATL